MVILMKKNEANTEHGFKEALTGIQLPILTLDNKWYKLFDGSGMPEEIRKKADELNDLLKKQGRVNSEVKKIKALKKTLLDEIVNLVEAAKGGDKAAEKTMEDHKKLIDQCNDKLAGYDDEMIDLPREIQILNRDLMLMTMEDCYERLQQNARDIEEISKWIDEFRIELKKNVVRKQEKEMISHNLYSYMHDIFGANVLELFDMEYAPERVTKGDPK